jgi:quercetin dioxygenase-like cupin family protein
MKVFHFTEVTQEEVTNPEAKGVRLRWLINDKTGAPTFAMRLFDVEPGGCTPYHEHWFEQEMYILEGTGRVIGENGATEIGPGTVLWVAPYDWHKVENSGTKTLRFICCIPLNRPAT